MYKRYLGVLLFCILFFFARSQTSFSQINDLPKITPPAPNTASLGKYGDIPVGLYTGISNISIPLYTIQVGKFSLPVSISYHSSGLKVEEQAGWIGLGWSLNSGGVITRSINGLADENGVGYWYHGNWTIDTLAANSNTTSACDGSIDLKPDMFYYNFAGFSGKFVMDATTAHAANFIPFCDLNLTHDNALNQFTIRDDNGTKYIFSSKESILDDNGGTITYYTSAWYLTRIVTPSGNIDFTYTSETTYTNQFYETDYLLSTPNTDASNTRPGKVAQNRVIQNNSLILNSITFPNGSLTVIKTIGRQDMPNASSITTLELRDNSNALIRKFKFSYGYFGSTSSTDANAVRLRLDSLQEMGGKDSVFTYKRTAFTYYSPTSVPSTKSLSRDYWGYYNGKNSNTTLLSYLSPTVYGTYLASQAANYGYGDRSTDFSSELAGTLKSIQYPTGGTTNFIYESNDYSLAEGITIGDTIKATKSVSSTVTQTTSTTAISQTKNFTLNTGQTITINVRGSYSNPPPVDNGPSITINQISSSGTKTAVYSRTMLNLSDVAYVALGNGNYELKASVDGSNQSATATVSYDSLTGGISKIRYGGGIRIKQIINADSVGGVNIKTYSYRSDTDTSKSSGALIANPIFIEEQESHFFQYGYWVRSSSPNNYLGMTQGNPIGYAVVTEKDSSITSIGKTVSNFTSGADYLNLKGTLYYTRIGGSYTQNTTTQYGSPNRTMTDYDLIRGYLIKKIVYNANNNIVKKTIYNYNIPAALNTLSPHYTELTSINAFKYKVSTTCCENATQCNISWGDVGYCNEYALWNYSAGFTKILCGWIYKTSEVDTTYDGNGANPIATKTNYYYENAVHGLPTKIESFNSLNDTMRTVNRYATEKSMIAGLSTAASLALDSMVAINKIRSAVEIFRYKNSTLLEHARTDYNIWNNSPLVVEDQNVWYGTLSNAMEDKIDYYSYDTSSNVLEIGKHSDTHLSYIYDYKNMLPIAQITNASQSQIAYTSFEADAKGNWILNNGTVVATSGMAGSNSYTLGGTNSITKAGLTSGNYIVTYWSINGSATINGSAGTSIMTHRGWTLYTHTFTNITSVNISGTVTIDELRLYPSTAQMTTYTYTPLIGMTSQCDAANHITYYEYDGLGRLKLIRNQDGFIIKQYDYQYQTVP